MPVKSFVQLDVFTNRVFSGNPLAVFPDGTGIDDATMQKTAREMNLSETVFVLPPTDGTKALRRLRIFTPATELPMAGHPVVGTWFLLAGMGVVPPPAGGMGRVTIHQEIKIGVLPVEIDFVKGRPSKVTMTQGSPKIGRPLDERGACAAALRLDEEDIGGWELPAVVASTGVEYLIIPVRNKLALSRIKPDTGAITKLVAAVGAHAVYAVSPEAHDPDALVSARMFGDEHLGVGEDPATGSAAGPLATALVHFGIARAEGGWARFVIEQGVDMGRASRIEAEVNAEGDQVQVVKIGGQAVQVLTGEMPL